MSRLKEFQSLVKNVESFSDRQVEILMDDIDFDQPLENFSINIKPNSGPYRGGQFKFSITCDSQLLAQCQTLPIYHPNIDHDDGTICFSLLDDNDTDNLSLEDVVAGLLYLMYNPVLNDPLSSLFSGGESWDEYVSEVRQTLRGGERHDEMFERNLLPGYEDDAVAMADRYRTVISKDGDDDSYHSDTTSYSSGPGSVEPLDLYEEPDCECRERLGPGCVGAEGTCVDDCPGDASSNSGKGLGRRFREFFLRLLVK